MSQSDALYISRLEDRIDSLESNVDEMRELIGNLQETVEAMGAVIEEMASRLGGKPMQDAVIGPRDKHAGTPRRAVNG